MTRQRAASPELRGIAAAVGLLFLGAAIAGPPARSAWLNLAPGDATLAWHCGLMACASLAGTIALDGLGWRALGRWLCVLSPSLTFLPGFPAILAPLGWVPFYAALLRSSTNRGAAVVGAFAASCQVLGSAGWIFQYFDRPLLPGLIAFTVVCALWAPLAAATRALVLRSAWWAPLAAGLIPLSEIIRGEWMKPPLPGLLMAHANADTALSALAPWFGEAGIGWIVGSIGLGGAIFLTTDRLRLGRVQRCAALLALGACLGAARPALAAIATAERIRTRVCAVKDPTRTQGGPAFGDGGEAAVLALAARAEALGCRIVAFPEYSLRLQPAQIVAADWGGEGLGQSMIVLGGASVVYRQRQEPSSWLRNVVCRLHLGPGRQINCAGAFDKLVFAPFGEVGLFQDVSVLSKLGAWVSRQATGTKYLPLRSIQPVGVLPIHGERRAAVAICWEILVPHIFERRGARGRGDVDLLVVVSDLDGFGGSTAAIDQFRRAGSLHSSSLGAPLLFASTNDPFVVNARGVLVESVLEESFLIAWEIEL